MNYTNLNTAELVREAEHTDNALALELHDRHAADLEQQQEQLDEVINEVAQHFADKIEADIEASNKEQLLPNSDNVRNYAEMISSDFGYDRVAQVIREIERSPRCLTEEALDYLLDIVDHRQQDRLEALTDAMIDASDSALDVEVSQGYGAVHYCLAGITLGEDEYDLEHWLNDLPEALRRPVANILTGTPDGTAYYVNNTDVAVNLTMNFDWLEEWVAEQQQAAAA